MTTTIPPITDPMGRHWYQPSTDDILLDDKHAVMAQHTFDQLSEYSTTVPSGVYNGKMWKSCWRGHWLLRWYDDHPTMPNRCVINQREILVS